MSEPFQWYVPFDVRKSEDSEEMLFGGFVSSEREDLEGEEVIQKGLNFDPFVSRGWFNENHESSLSGGGVVGVPVENQSVQWLSKGQLDPLNRTEVDRGGWYVMGQMLDTPQGKSIFDIASALQKAGTSRRLGMSLEGNVTKRNGQQVEEADVHNIALTQRPVNPDTTVEVICKALKGEGPLITDEPRRLEKEILARLERIEKAMSAGASVNAPGSTGGGDGFAYRSEDLEKKKPSALEVCEGDVQASMNKMAENLNSDGGDPKMSLVREVAESSEAEYGEQLVLGYGAAYDVIRKRYPNLTDSQCKSATNRIFNLGGS